MPTAKVKAKPKSQTYSTIPCYKAECFDDNEFKGHHYHSTDPKSDDFLIKVVDKDHPGGM